MHSEQLFFVASALRKYHNNLFDLAIRHGITYNKDSSRITNQQRTMKLNISKINEISLIINNISITMQLKLQG